MPVSLIAAESPDRCWLCSAPAWERAQAARRRMGEDTQQAQRLRDVRDRLCMLLEDSDLYDARHVLEQIGHTELWDEQVVLHSKVRAVWNGPRRFENTPVLPLIHKHAALQNYLDSLHDDVSHLRHVTWQDCHLYMDTRPALRRSPCWCCLLKLESDIPLHQVLGTLPRRPGPDNWPRAQLGDHRAALRILALTLGDIRLAEAYCARFAGREGHLLLLDLLLHPGDERPPLYIEACHLLAAQGGPCARAHLPASLMLPSACAGGIQKWLSEMKAVQKLLLLTVSVNDQMLLALSVVSDSTSPAMFQTASMLLCCCRG